MTQLCDTNVLSELVKRAPNPGVLTWASESKRIAISVISLEEALFGLSWRPNPRIESWLDDVLTSLVAVLPVTEEIAGRAGRLRGALQAKGSTRAQADILIAATAQVHQLTVVTRNTRHFEGCGIGVLNPFS